MAAAASRVRAHGCGHCGGDQYLDTYEAPHEWVCLQCARRVPVVAQMRQPVALAPEAHGRRHYPAANLRVA